MFNDDFFSNALLPIRNLDSLLDGALTSAYARTSAFFKEEDGVAYLTVDLPGVKQEDLQVEINGRVVSIIGERKTKTYTSSYSKSFTIPEKYDLNSLLADLSDGVLTLEIKNKAVDQKTSRKISVNSK